MFRNTRDEMWVLSSAAPSSGAAPESTDRIDALIEQLRSPNARLREQARSEIVHVGPRAISRLIGALDDPTYCLRWEATKALVEMQDPSAALSLVNLIRDDDSGIRWMAAEGLARMGCTGLVATLGALSMHSDSPWMREGARYVLRRASGHEMNHLLKPVLAALNGVEPALEVVPVARTTMDRLQLEAECSPS
jgi:HEAT repeat protein